MKTQSTKILLIINSMLMIIIIALLLLLNYDTLKNKFVMEPSTDSFETTYEDYPEEMFYPQQDTIEIDFNRLKNDEIPLPTEIIEKIETELEDFNWNQEFGQEDVYSMYHETIFAHQFPSEPTPFKKLIVIIFSNNTANLCHAACGRVSLFEFQKQCEYWMMTNKHLAFGSGSDWAMEPEGCEIVRIGTNNKYAAIIHTSYSGNGGHDMETKTVFTEVADGFEPVFEFISYEHYNDYPQDVEYIEGYSCMRIVTSNKAYFDIETKSNAVEWNENNFGEIKRFVFNGKEYVEAILPAREQE